MSQGISRRQFLRGQFGRRQQAARPPWALAEAGFLAACTRCGECVDHCPQHILVKDQAGYPKVDFAPGECTFCGECAARCQPRALQRREQTAPWRLKAFIGPQCLARVNVVCRACGDACPVRAIRFHPQLNAAAQPALDPVRCTGCGACYRACPARAISMEPI
ncbi:MAG: ferredoxin-type protein NapF [Pseudomonadota bacterium]|jgi:ferredoxin-type protein NapF